MDHSAERLLSARRDPLTIVAPERLVQSKGPVRTGPLEIDVTYCEGSGCGAIFSKGPVFVGVPLRARRGSPDPAVCVSETSQPLETDIGSRFFAFLGKSTS